MARWYSFSKKTRIIMKNSLHLSPFISYFNQLFTFRNTVNSSNFKRSIFPILFCFMVGFSMAQTANERPFRAYNTQRVHKRLAAENPAFALNLQVMEGQIATYGATGDVRMDTVSLIFHILYSPGQPYPDEAQVLAQVDALNKDFGAYEAALEPFVFDKMQQMSKKAITPGIFFCLPVQGVDGANMVPIRFIQTSTTLWKDDDAIKSGSTGGADPLDTRHFLNIWVGSLDNFNSGYAQMPTGPDKTDGIVIDPDFFGVSTTSESPYNKGKTLTHLIGSYLGLYELWNEITPCGDDKVEDTPIHNAPNYGLGTNYHHVSLCDSVLAIEMVINFMDNTDDEALVMFTQGQKNRMKTILSSIGPRADLVAWNHACQPNGHRAADIRDDKTKPLSSNLVSAFKLFPNPSKGTINLEVNISKPGTVTFSTFNVLGEMISRSSYALVTGGQIFSQNCDTWSPGMYFIEAAFEDGSTITRNVYLDKP